MGDGLDLDCDGGEICRADVDMDGYAAEGGATVVSADTDCDDDGEADAMAPGGDCDDTNPDVRPGGEDFPADGIDGDCNGGEVCFSNGGDGVAAAGALTIASLDADCDDPGEATASDEPDCDDTDPSVYPGAPEIVVDGIDQDCDGGDACYADADMDGYRAADGATIISADADCDDPGEASAEMPPTDCDDTDDTINPGAPGVGRRR